MRIFIHICYFKITREKPNRILHITDQSTSQHQDYHTSQKERNPDSPLKRKD